MVEAAKGAVFVWVNSHFNYPRALAKRIGREDLVIVSPSFLDDDHRWRGRVFTGIVVDHAAFLNDREHENYMRALANVRAMDTRGDTNA
jgi:hypothetical protein